MSVLEDINGPAARTSPDLQEGAGALGSRRWPVSGELSGQGDDQDSPSSWSYSLTTGSWSPNWAFIESLPVSAFSLPPAAPLHSMFYPALLETSPVAAAAPPVYHLTCVPLRLEVPLTPLSPSLQGYRS